MKDKIIDWLLRHIGLTYVYQWVLKNTDKDFLLRKVLESIEWYDDSVDWTDTRKKTLVLALRKNEVVMEFLHYLWARDRKQLFDLVAMGQKFDREDQLIKYGAMARLASIITQLRDHKIE